MEYLLGGAVFLALIWATASHLCRSKDSRSWGTARLKFLSPLPDRLYGRDLKRAYLAATITELSPVAAAMVGLERNPAIGTRVGERVTPKLRALLDQGINDREIFRTGGTHEIETAEFSLRVVITRVDAALYLTPVKHPLENGVVH